VSFYQEFCVNFERTPLEILFRDEDFPSYNFIYESLLKLSHAFQTSRMPVPQFSISSSVIRRSKNKSLPFSCTAGLQVFNFFCLLSTCR
jgi:hypothetical protein